MISDRTPIAPMGPIATATPPGILDVERSMEIADLLTPAEVPRPVLRRLHERSGIDRRHAAVVEPDGSIPIYGIGAPGEASGPRRPGTRERMAVYHRAASDLATEAAAAALEASGTAIESITHLVTASCTGFGAPGADLEIVRRLGLPASVRRTNVGFMGCHAAVNALAAARAYALEDPSHVVLVVTVEVSTVHFHHDTRMDRLISNILFADGAASTVVGGPARRDAAGGLLGTASHVIPESHEAMAWEVGDHGFEMTLAAEVPDRIAASLGAWVDDVLGRAALDRGSVGGWAIHPGGPRVIDAVRTALDLPDGADEASRGILRTRGNMSSSTLLHILERFQQDRIPRPWVGLAFGPGLTGELVLLT
ncbi:MAG: type III polyketide synthase [Planctomycetota bacterium]|nr:type III polyketide synthase [Planctomycetota bacterium]